MNKNFDGRERASLPVSVRSLTRREWVQRMLAGAGAGIAAPAVAAATSSHHRLVSHPASSAASAEAAAGEWKPEFFDDYQNRTVIALAEKIVPGSTAVEVNRFLDTALGAETLEVQREFVTSLNALEGEALRRYTKSFMDLSTSQQDELLTAASTARPSDSNLEDAGEDEDAPRTRSATPNLRDYFDHLKNWISMAYYSSEPGMKELGWTGDNFFTTFTGCDHAGGHS